MGTVLEAIVREPKTPANACVIWLHGLGADGYDFSEIVPSLSLSPRHAIRFVFPHAPFQPVTFNSGLSMRAWYDVVAIDWKAREDEEGIRRSDSALRFLIEKTLEEGIASNRIVLVGFSQGGALALYTALRFEKPLGGVCALSTYLPMRDLLAKEASPANRSIPIFMTHGLMDPVVSYWMGQHSAACLQREGYLVEWHPYPSGHTVGLQALDDLGRWLNRLLVR